MKVKRITLFSVLIFFILLMVLGTFLDLQISINLADLEFGQYYSGNFFGRLFEVIGELPVYLILGFSFIIILLNIRYDGNSLIKNLIKSLFLLFSIISFFLFYFKAFWYILKYVEKENYLFTSHLIIIFILLGFTSSYFSLLFFHSLDKKIIRKLLIFAIFCILVIALSNLISQLLKPIFNRERFRAMKLLSDTSFSGYTPWYKINKVSFNIAKVGRDAFKSFPSGHTTASCSLVCLFFLFELFPSIKKTKIKLLVYIPVILWIILVGFSRIVMGAHYLSDVCFGAFVTILCYFLIMHIYHKKNKNKFIKGSEE